LAESIRGHNVAGVIDLGWAALTNGRLPDAMAGQFGVMVTVDKGIPFSNASMTAPWLSSSYAPQPTAFLTFCRSYRRCFRPLAM
jgi:hypothetical protein